MSSLMASFEDRVVPLLHDAAVWRLLARLFESPDATWRSELTQLAREVTDEDLAAVVPLVDENASVGQYYSVFGPGGPAPPREASYHESVELGSLMSELTGYYEAFGYVPVTQETPDHIAIEVGFVSYLKLKQAYAAARGDEQQETVAAEAATRFVSDHLSRVAQPIAQCLADSPTRYLAEAARVLACRVGPRPSSRLLPVIHPAVDDVDETGELTCGIP